MFAEYKDKFPVFSSLQAQLEKAIEDAQGLEDKTKGGE